MIMMAEEKPLRGPMGSQGCIGQGDDPSAILESIKQLKSCQQKYPHEYDSLQAMICEKWTQLIKKSLFIEYKNRNISRETYVVCDNLLSDVSSCHYLDVQEEAYTRLYKALQEYKKQKSEGKPVQKSEGKSVQESEWVNLTQKKILGYIYMRKSLRIKNVIGEPK